MFPGPRDEATLSREPLVPSHESGSKVSSMKGACITVQPRAGRHGLVRSLYARHWLPNARDVKKNFGVLGSRSNVNHAPISLFVVAYARTRVHRIDKGIAIKTLLPSLNF